MGNIDAKVFILASEYAPSLGWSAVPVFPPISKYSTSANFAVPSSVLTIFLRAFTTCSETPLFNNLFFLAFFSRLFLTRVGFMSYPPFDKIA